MHRLRSPLIALIAILLLAGPIASQFSQIDPNDPLQFSTPSAWERSTQEITPVAEPGFSFSHTGVTEDSSLVPRYSMGEIEILVSTTEITAVDRLTMTPIWSFVPGYEIVRISRIFSETSPQLILSGESTCTMLNVMDGSVAWESSSCPEGTFNEFDEGFLLHGTGDVENYTYRMIDRSSGADLWSHTFEPNSEIGGRGVVTTDQQIRYIATADGVEALSLNTGEVLWSTPVVSEWGIQLVGSHVLVLGNEEIIALDAETGAEMWFSFMEPGYSTGSIWAQPETGEKLLIQYDTATAVLDVTTGLEIARFPDSQLFSYVFSEHFILTEGEDTVWINWDSLDRAAVVSNTGQINYSGTYENFHLYKTSDSHYFLVDAETGARLRTFDASEYSSVADRSVLVFRSDARIVAHDTSTGSWKWQYTADAEIRRWASNNDHVVITAGRQAIVLDATTGEEVRVIPFPDDVEVSWTNSRFMLFWNGYAVSVVHNLTGTTTSIDGIFSTDDITYSNSGEIFYVRDMSNMTLINSETGRRVALLDLPIDIATSDGTFILLTEGSQQNTLSRIASSGEVVWELDVPQEFQTLLYSEENDKIRLYSRTNTYLVDASTGTIIMEVPYAYNPDGDNDTITLSPANAVMISSDAMTVIYQVPTPATNQLVEDTVVRGAPSATGVERMTLPAGTEVFPTGNTQERSDGTWIEISVDGTSGWIHSSSLTMQSATPEVSPVATP